SAVYFYGQPDQLSDLVSALNLTATAQDGSAVTVSSGPTPSQAHQCDQGRPPSGQFFGFRGTDGQDPVDNGFVRQPDGPGHALRHRGLRACCTRRHLADAA